MSFSSPRMSKPFVGFMPSNCLSIVVILVKSLIFPLLPYTTTSLSILADGNMNTVSVNSLWFNTLFSKFG